MSEPSMSDANAPGRGPDAVAGEATQKSEFDLELLRTLVANDPGCPEFPALAEAERRAGQAEAARRISEEGLAEAPSRMAGRVSLGLALLDGGRLEEARLALSEILDPVLEPHRLNEADISAWSDAPIEDEVSERAGESVPEVDDSHDSIAAAPAVTAAFDGELHEAELDQAFDQAESRPDEMVSANRMAEQVLMDHAPVDEAGEIDDEDDEGADFAIGAVSALRTETMAALLEKQGDTEGAAAIRSDLRASREGLGEEPRPTDAAEAPQADLADLAGIEEISTQTDRPGLGTAVRKSRILATLENWLHNIQRGSA